MSAATRTRSWVCGCGYRRYDTGSSDPAAFYDAIAWHETLCSQAFETGHMSDESAPAPHARDAAALIALALLGAVYVALVVVAVVILGWWGVLLAVAPAVPVAVLLRREARR